ncbi:uncharacterized membrane protein [Cereibacter ovatus]|uniref:Uncharacterized membrane protein n=1 Tax=Cereibacter ovatus TaxID=439529 RepID=A0A285CMI5_9RHOB|nr:DUF2339 domain-containing protein [Cereibacter ovatus]SNX68769.1 uncharacterized membrane protein [Cereibacter ovatus]
MDEGTIILLALLTLAIVVGTPVATVVLLVRQARLTARLAEVEAALARLGSPAPAADALPDVMARPQPDPVAPPAPASDALPVTADRPPPIAGPWDRAPAPETQAEPAPERPYVLRRDRLARLFVWLRTNWAFTLSAVSLALAGIFFVQYGIEQGLLPPALRVAAAVAFGLGLIAAGEWVRRRGGEGEDAPALYLPSVFSAAGIVSVYAGIVAGRLLYALYGPGLTLAGLVATTLGAVVLGWRHGPFLVAMGLLGAGAAPFLVAGGSGATAALYPYYLLIAFLGLAVDAFRRWAWVSVLALVVGMGGAFLMALAGAGDEGWALALLGFAVMAVVVPERAPIPEHEAPAILDALMGGGSPSFPVRLAFGTVVATTLALWLTLDGMWSFAALAALALGLAVASLRAPGIGDLAILPAAAFLAQLWTDERSAAVFSAQTILLREPETAPPATVSVLLLLAGLVTLALAQRARGALLRPLALAAVLAAPVAAALLEFRWLPAPVLGLLPWALHVMAVAGLMTWLAWRWAGQADRRPMAWAVLSALSAVALALFLLLDAAALTLAFGVLAVTAVWLDRRLSLVEMGWFMQAAVAAISYRLVVDPGLDWAGIAPLGHVLVAFSGAIMAALAARHLLASGRRIERAVAESAVVVWAALLTNVLFLRGLPPDQSQWTHWFLTLQAVPWLLVAGAQLWRVQGDGGRVDLLRRVIAAGAALLAAVPLLLSLTLANPLVAGADGRIIGPPILDSLALAYAVPAALLIAGALLPALGRLRRSVRLLGIGFAILWLALEIRRLWQGERIDAPGVMQGELYSYTLAMLVAGAALLWLAVQRRSEPLRRLAMVVIGVTVAKVFLWDAAGLSGLVRVLSFACLGLALAGMAWLNALIRRAMADQGKS